jgi:transcriptional regulator with XRE-family HTH domain
MCALDARQKWDEFIKMSDMEIYRRLGRLVAKRRAELDLTQGDVAEKIGLSRASLANLENGRQRIMLHQLFALVNALELVSILDLVPATWEPTEPLPEIKVAGASLTPKQQSGVERLVASAVAEELVRKRPK